jgi:predicted kinase
MIEKTVIINRAVPGSGKTTITNYIVDELKRNNLSVSVHSTDEYFMVGNKYIFDLEKLGEYHNKNLESFKKSILDDTNVVICDNTNIAPWQAEPYTKLAREYNYNIIFISLNPRELDKHIASQKVTAEKPDAHGVHEDILKMMMKEYYIYDDLLNKNMVINEQTQINYKWHEILNKKIQVDIATYFDNDYVIRILPNEYQMAQNTIGTNILKLINGDKKKYSSNPSNQELSNITKKDQLKNSPLHIAIIFNDIESIRFLLNQGFDINIKDNNGLTALEFAFFKENYRIIKELYAFFPNEIQNYILNNWISSLPLATYLENLIIMKLLIEKGADLNIKSEQGESPLHIAINSDNFELVKFLVESKVDLDIEDNYGNTPIMVAFKKNNIKIIKYLIAQHNKIKPISRKIISAFYAKIDTKEYIETLEIFLQMININVNEKVHFDFFKQIFIKNISDIDKSIIRIFIDNGIDINSKLDKNSTIIQYARNQSEKYAWFINLINERSNNNPHHLIELLSTFTIKKPIKFSTHEWDNNLKSNQYKNFDLYMNTIKNQFNSI